MVDNFERAKMQIKTETEGEETINDSYQSIYKQFVQIMRTLGVSVVETVGQRFDPTLHEAIMREESAEFEEGIIIEEFRRGFKLGDMFLRPAMVKVSAGPGPAKAVEASAETADSSSETAGSSSDTAEAVGSSAETAKTADSCGERVAEPDKTTKEPE
uniref:GrpE protein homolog n=1 Tax=Araucaria cunninghamii TaxID=56994 RepID=A0A0D6R7E9_ARACU